MLATSLRKVLSFVFAVLAVSIASAQTPLRLVNVTPCRLVDTRSQTGGLGFHGTMTFNLPMSAQSGGASGNCMPFSLASAQAYSLNVTLVTVQHHRVGFLTIWPTGQTQPTVSLMNSDGRTKANAAIVPAGTNGKVNVFLTDDADVLIDIDAYFDSASDSSALAFFPLPPCRIVDTRNNQDGGTLQAGVERDYPIPGNCSVPSNAAAYSFNVTVLPTQGSLDYLTVWPQGVAMPVVSTLNDGPGTVVANAAIVPAGPNSKTAFFAHNHNTDLLLDVNGYFAPANAAPNPLSLFTLTPCRILDTRNGIGLFSGTIPVGIVGSSCGVPGSNPEAFVLNATVVPPGRLGYLQLWPEGGSQQGSTLNANDGAITSNMAVVPAGTGNDSINAFASNPTQLILDISSYFAPVTAVNILNTSVPAGTLNAGYSFQLTAAGGVAPYSWTLTSGNLPPDFMLSSSGVISGFANNTGSFNFTVQAADSNNPAGTASASFTLVVNQTTAPLAITTTSLPNASVNTPYNTLMMASGGIPPYTWSVSFGSLPAGLSLGSTGLISGSASAPGLAQVFIQVSDSAHSVANQQFNLAVDSGNANGTLNGTYAISFTGYSQSNPGIAVGSLTFDGDGNVIGGETDLSNGSSVEHDTITGGTYTVGSDGLGQVNWTDDHGGNVQMLIAVGSAEDLRIIAYNQDGAQGTWGAGVLRQQNHAIFNLGALAGSWTFGFQGFDATLAAQAGAGLYHQDANGNVSGQEDVNIDGQESTVPFSGTIGAPDMNGRATLQIQIGHQIMNYAAYLISANQIVIGEIQSGGGIVIANSLRQSGTLNNGIFNGKAVGRESRSKNNGMIVSDAFVLLASFDGAGSDSLTIDENFGGTLLLQQMGSGNYSVDPTTGRTFVGGGGGGDICYPVQLNEAYCFDPSSSHPGSLFFQAQATGQHFNTAYLNGQYLGGSLPQYVPSTDSTIDALFADGLGNGTTTSSQSGPDGTTLNQTGNGTYSVDSTGHITLFGNGSPVAYGYLVGPDKFFLISTGADPRVLIQTKSAAP
jgi:hypothetical protein